MAELRIKEIRKTNINEDLMYYSYHYTIDNDCFEHWIDVQKDGVVFNNDIKVDKLISKEDYLKIISNEEFRLNYMNDLIIGITEYTHKYESKCRTLCLEGLFNKGMWRVHYNRYIDTMDELFDRSSKDLHLIGELIDFAPMPHHYDDVEMCLIDAKKMKMLDVESGTYIEVPVVIVFECIAEKVYICTVKDDIFEIENQPYSINCFYYDDEFMSPFEYFDDKVTN